MWMALPTPADKVRSGVLNGVGDRPPDLRVQSHLKSVIVLQEKVQICKGQGGVLARKYKLFCFRGECIRTVSLTVHDGKVQIYKERGGVLARR